MPPAERPALEGGRVALAEPGSWKGIRSVDLETAIRVRKSHRKFTESPLSLDELAFLLWATQGVSRRGADRAYRTVPSAGCRHAFETTVAAMRVEGLEPGLWRYLPLSHALVREGTPERLPERLVSATLGQSFCGSAAATFCWTCVPARMEWRYDRAAHRAIALDAGHVAQNLYLACAAVGCGTCAVAAYDQKAMDDLLGVDGDEEFTLYLSPVGKL
jgi:SagB-type dehydrogenase family enzyme